LYKDTANITNFVSAEIMRGMQTGHLDLRKIHISVEEGWIKEVVLPTNREKSLFEKLSISLGLGEASSIAIAQTRDFIFACDDKTARRETEFLDTALTETLGILRNALQCKIVTLDLGNKILAEMVAQGFYSPVSSLKKP
jgi:predicted nucleic acid-binding protein